jgi:tetratricopeptide (TPR) repeat protein
MRKARRFMPSARGSLCTLLAGAIVTVCGSMAIGDDPAPAPSGKSAAPALAPSRDGAVQQALRNLYIVPKASNGAAAGRPSAAPPAWRDRGGSPHVEPASPSSPTREGSAQTQPASRWSPNLATPYRLKQRSRAEQTAAEPPDEKDMRSAGLGQTRPAYPEQDRSYSPRSIGGYRGVGEFGYGRQGYADYRRTIRWPGYSVEGYDEFAGAYRENFSYYGDSSPYGWGYDYGYFEYLANERTNSLIHSGLTSRDRGLTAFREGRYREAVDAFRLACETNQGDPAAQLYAGHALFAIGRYRDGVRHLRRALELQPKIVFLTYDMRDDYRDRVEFDRQFAALESALRISPRDEDRLFMLGYVLYYGGQRDRAYAAFARLLRVNPRDSLAMKLYDACQPPDVVVGAMSGSQP